MKLKEDKHSFDGLTAQDWVDMFNKEAEKSGLTTRATVKKTRCTKQTDSGKPLKEENK